MEEHVIAYIYLHAEDIEYVSLLLNSLNISVIFF